MGKSKQAPTETEESVAPWKSPIAEPLLDGKALERSLKLLKKATKHEKEVRADKSIKGAERQVTKRGVTEISKAIRKGEKGIVFLASDVFPVDVISHLPVYCEENKIIYAFIGCKKTLGVSIGTTRSPSALMVTKNKKAPYAELYDKVESAIRKQHPHFS